MIVTTLKELTPGQLFHHKNVDDHPLNRCKYLGVIKTAENRKSFRYSHRGEIYNGYATELVIAIA